MTWILFGIGIVIQFLILIIYSHISFKEIKKNIQLPKEQKPVTVKVDISQLEKSIKQIPNKVLNSITSSANSYKGNLGELIGYLQLNAEYDRIFSLGGIVDFIGVTFPTETTEGRLVFIDIKTGNGRLSNDQRKLRDIIKAKNVEFQKYNISISSQQESSNDSD